jgi:hypothetical protein
MLAVGLGQHGAGIQRRRFPGRRFPGDIFHVNQNRVDEFPASIIEPVDDLAARPAAPAVVEEIRDFLRPRPAADEDDVLIADRHRDPQVVSRDLYHSCLLAISRDSCSGTG